MDRFCVIFKYVGSNPTAKEVFHINKYDWTIFPAQSDQKAYESFLNSDRYSFAIDGKVIEHKKDFKVLEVRKFNSSEEEENFKNKYWEEL